MTHDQEPDQEVKPLILSEDERSLIAQLDFQAKATLLVFQMAVDFWLEPETIHGQPKALESTKRKAIVVREQIQRIQAILPSIETHTNIHIRTLFEPASQFLKMLKELDKLTSEMQLLMEINMNKELPNESPARARFTRIAKLLDKIIEFAQPNMEAIQHNLAYAAYRDKTNEADRKR